MIQQELEFFPNPTLSRHKLRSDVDHESKHAGESSVPNDNEESSKQKRYNSCLERLHGIRCECEAEIVEHRPGSEDAPRTWIRYMMHDLEDRRAYHQTLDWLTLFTTGPHVLLCTIQGRRMITPSRWNMT